MKKTCVSMRYYIGFFSYKCGASLFQTTSFRLAFMRVLELHRDKIIALVPRARTFDYFFHTDNNQRKPHDTFIRSHCQIAFVRFLVQQPCFLPSWGFQTITYTLSTKHVLWPTRLKTLLFSLLTKTKLN